MADQLEWFQRNFRLLTGNQPFVWQQQLFENMIRGEFPERIHIPTGCGKTAIIHIWLLALASTALHGSHPVPRRLVWIVNNRAVVDQATAEAEILAGMMACAPPELEEVARVIRDFAAMPAADGRILAVSTLRGQRADNREWSKDPSRPAAIVGTVDMIGSRLLFRGYGDTRKVRARYAGLLGQDSLIVNDEAHLTPAFAELLAGIRDAQGPRAIRIMTLSATPRDGNGGFPQNLDADLADEQFRKRVEARKILKLCPTPDTKAMRAKILELARQPHNGAGQRTIVYVSSPEEASKLAQELKKTEGEDRVFLLTGTMRGLERDRLCNTGVFRRFLERIPGQGPPVWGVMTSAGEVGINITAERMITEMDSADHLLQRFGRLNRFGAGTGEAYVVWSEKAAPGKKRQDRDACLAMTREYLKRLPACDGGYDISPAALWRHRPGKDAMSVAPKRPPLLPWLLEAWALTSINHSEWRDLPAVEPWLHGAADDEPAAEIAWREDVELLARTTGDEIEAVLKAHRVRAHERLQEPAYRVSRKLSELAEAAGERPVIIVASDGSAEPLTLRQAAERSVAYSLVLLPPGVGSLNDAGMFETASGECEYDVADLPEDTRLERARFRFYNDDGWKATQIGVKNSIPHETGALKLNVAELRRFGRERGMVLREYVEVDASTGSPEGRETVAYYSVARSGKRHGFVSFDTHTSAVQEAAAALNQKLGLGAGEAEALKLAAQFHDEGKKREVWQTAAGKPTADLVAKAPHINWRLLSGYRHELGSLVKLELPAGTDADVADLALHLIAAHHGWARPHFPPEAVDRENILLSRRIANEAMVRFARLQERYGLWGLAHLEAVFCAADALASAAETEVADA
jgi:CRISPR-associated endonuclease/helicase Cas3